MKKVTKLLLLVSALSAVAILPACKDKEEEKPSEPPVLIEPVDENEVYYFEEDGKEYLFSIAVDKFTIHAFDKALTGSVQKVNGAYEFKFDNTDVNASVKFEDDTLVLTYEGKDYKFLKKVNYTVTFDTDNGSVATVAVLNGKTVAKPSNPTKDGYIFVGWYTSKSYDTVFDFEHTVVTNDLTVYAKFVQAEVGKSEYTVQYYLDDQLYETAQTVSGKILNLPVPTQEGKEFVGWWVSSTGNKDELSYQYKDQVLTENTTLFAVWKSDTPLVSVTATGASWTSVSSDNITYTVMVKDANGKTVLEPTTTGSLKYDIDFANMAPGAYTVSVTGNGKTGVGYYMNKMLDKVSLFSVVEPSLLVFSPVPNATKYLLYVDCNNEAHQHNPYDLGKNTYYDFSNCEMQEGGIKFKVVASAKGFAESTSEEYVCNRQLDGVTGLTVEKDQVVWNPVLKATSYVVEIKSGEHTDTFNVGNVTSYDLKNYTGELTINVYPYTAGYNTTKVNAITYNKTTLIAPKNVTVEGTTVQWDAVDGAASYNVMIGGTQVNATTNSYELTEELLAKADVLEVSVQAVASKAENNSAYSDIVAINCNSLVGEIRYEDGKIYWDYVVGATKYLVQVGDEKEFEVTSGTSAPVTFKKAGNITIRVCSYSENGQSPWVETSVNVQTIYFDSCDGANLKPIYKAVGDTVELPTTTYTGYNFAGWYNMAFGPEANALEYKTGLTMPSKDLYLYAYWTSMPYEVTLSGVDERGTLEETSKVVYYDKAFTLPVPTPISSNFVFEGWYTEMNGAGQKLADLKGDSVAKWNIASDATIYANWVNVIDYVALAPSGEVTGYRAVPGAGFDLVTEVTIAETYENLPVVDLGSFAGKTNLKVLNVPSTIQAISTELGFTGCRNLEAINVYKVEDQSTEPVYASYEGILYYNNTASELAGWQLEFFPTAKEGECHIMPGTVHIPAESLESADITSIYIPSSVKNIGDEAFYYSDIQLVVFEPTKEGEEEAPLTIGQRAFYGTDIVNITLPKRLVSFDVLFTTTSSGYVEDHTMFAGCYDLENIYFEEGTTKYTSKDGMVCNENGTKILYSPQAKSGTLRIPDGVKVIGYRSFYSCDMEELIIPGAVTEIEAEAFYSCYYLKNIQFEGDADSEPLTIRSQAFYDSNLKSLVIPENAKTIEAYAFGGNYSLTKVTILTSGDANLANGITQSKPYSGNLGSSYVSKLVIGPNVKEFNIGGAFNGSNNRLQTIEIDSKNEHFSEQDEVVYNKDKSTLLFYPNSKRREFVVPETVIEIGDGAFMYKDNLPRVTIGKNVAKIGTSAFASCSGLKTVIFEDGGTAKLEICDDAFKNCESLLDVTFPTRLSSIGTSAFAGCESFESIVLPEGITSIGEYAFKDCTNVARFYIPSTLEKIGDYVGEAGTSITVLDACNSLASIKVAPEHKLFASSDGVLYLKTNDVITTLCLCPIARSGDLVIPKTVNSINAKAFYQNALVKNISFEDGKSAVTVDEDGKETEGVLTIGASAFEDCSALEMIQLPNITTLGKNMFDGCKSLLSFEVPNTVATIDNNAFSYCSSLKTLTFEDGNEDLSLEILDGKYGSSSPFSYVSSLEAITLPARTTLIGDYAFYQCSALKSCVIPEGVTKIGRYAFYQCRSLETITIPSSVTTLGSLITNWSGTTVLEGYVFHSCANLTDVKFAADSQIKQIPDYAFTNCTSLVNINLPKGLESIGRYAFTSCDKLANLDMPTTVITIGDNAFSYCSSLTSISIPSTTETLGVAAFNQCAALEKVEFGADTKIEDINKETFSGCEKLTSVVIPASVKKILEKAFLNTTLLTSVTFAGENVHTIGERAFENSGLTSFAFPTLKIDGKVQAFTLIGTELFTGCQSLETVTLSGSFNKSVKVFYGCSSIKNVIVDASNENFAVTKANDVVILTNKDGSSIKAVFGEIVDAYEIPSNITSVDAYAFSYQSKLTKLTIPSTVNEIGEYAFANCPTLKTVQFETTSTINTMGAYVFSECIGLTTVTLPEKMEIIPENAFARCISLTNITLPSALTKISDYAFSDTKNLTSLSMPETLVEISGYAFSGSGLTSITLPDSLTTLGRSAFSDCTNLKTVTLPQSLETMGNNCFDSTGIEKIVIPGSLEILPSYAFRGCSKLSEVTLSEGILELGSQAFQNCISLKTLQIPNSVESLGSDLFWSSGLETVTIPESVKSIGSWLFEDCTNLREVVFNAQVAEISSSTFEDCEKLTSVTLSDSIETIGQSAFNGCTALTEIKLPSKLKKILNYAFENSGIKHIEIPETVELLGGSTWSAPTAETTTHVFSDCLELESVTFKGNLLTFITAESFNNTPKLKNINLPSSITEIGSGAFKESGLQSFDNSNITYLGDDVFADCKALTKVNLPSLLTIGKSVFTNCTLLSNVTISQNLKTISEELFSGCSALTEIELPAIAEAIEKDAFKDCIELGEIVIPETVTLIGENAFAGCLKLAKVTFDGSSRLATISNNAFENCAMITSFKIPESVATIGDFAFRGTSIAGQLLIPSKVENIGYNPFGSLGQVEVVVDSSSPFFKNNEQGAIYMANVLVYYPVSATGTVTLASGDEIRPYAFYNCNSITKVELPSDMTAITEACFAGMGGLQELVVPESVTTIGMNAFYNASIGTLTLPSKVTLEPYAFAGLKTSTLTMPAIEVIPDYCFSEAEIDEVILPEGLIEIGQHALEKSTITKFDLPASVKILQSYAFAESAFETISFANTIEKFGTYLFKNSVNLREVTFAEGMTKIESGSSYSGYHFDGCVNLEAVHLPSTLTELPYAFFAKSGLKSIALPEGIKETSSDLFYGCEQLTSVTLPSTLEKITSYTFQNCTALTSITIPDTVAVVGSYSFKGCTNLASITLPSTLETIESSVFQDCTSLTSIIIPDTVKELGSYCFSGCTGLTSVTMPSNLESMSSACFADCTGIKELIIKGNVSLENCWSGAFLNWTADQTIKFTCSEDSTISWGTNWNQACLAKIEFNYVEK